MKFIFSFTLMFISQLCFAQQQISLSYSTFRGIDNQNKAANTATSKLGRNNGAVYETVLDFNDTDIGSAYNNIIITSANLSINFSGSLSAQREVGITNVPITNNTTWNSLGGDGLLNNLATTFSTTINGSTLTPSSGGDIKSFVYRKRFGAEDIGIGFRTTNSSPNGAIATFSNPSLVVEFVQFFMNVDAVSQNRIISPDHAIEQSQDYLYFTLSCNAQGGFPYNQNLTFNCNKGEYLVQYETAANFWQTAGTNLAIPVTSGAATKRIRMLPMPHSTSGNVIADCSNYNYDNIEIANNSPPIIASVGDSNLDGQFDSSDLITVLQGGQFENGGAATWILGDWNGDGLFNTTDLIVALQNGNYEGGAAALAADWEDLQQ